jgi:hypothetical protein
MSALPTFDEYVATLGRLTAHVDPLAPTPEAEAIRDAASSLTSLPSIDAQTLTDWVTSRPDSVPVLGLAVGLSQERLKNVLKHNFDTSSWRRIATERAADLIQMLDHDFDLLRQVEVQRAGTFTFGDVLVARAGTRVTATSAGVSGRKVEDEIEVIARDLGLDCQLRTRFIGRNNRDAPCDLAVPNGPDALIVVAAKGFDSTGSKLTDAVREIQEMADVRQARQYVMAVIDGIGWKSRMADLKRLYDLWETKQIDGMYTLASLGQFRADLIAAAQRSGLLS